MKTIGMNIANRRRAVAMTQEQVAEKMSATAQAVSKWENDQASPDADTLVRLSRLFNVSVDDLLTGSNLPAVAEADPDTIAGRLLHITTITTGSGVPEVNVDLRIPVAVVKAAAGVGAALYIDPGQMEIVNQMLESGVVGEMLNTTVHDGGMDVTTVIAVEKGENE